MAVMGAGKGNVGVKGMGVGTVISSFFPNRELGGHYSFE